MTEFAGKCGRTRETVRRFLPAALSAALLLTLQLLVFYATRPLLAQRVLYQLSTPLDARIPFVPAWVSVYFLSFIFWAVNVFLILTESPARRARFTAAYALALLIAAAFFLLLPGTIERPAVRGDGLFERWTRRLYQIDEPLNLCPSLHVVMSYFCWRALGGSRIRGWYKGFSLLFLLLVCACILFVKQHVLIDIPVAFAVSELCWQLTLRLRLERFPLALERRLFREDHSI